MAITAVQEAKSICIESKKKNMTSSEMDAPRGRHIACRESRVWIPDPELLPPRSLGVSLSLFLSGKQKNEEESFKFVVVVVCADEVLD